jgi:hypothetical protein
MSLIPPINRYPFPSIDLHQVCSDEISPFVNLLLLFSLVCACKWHCRSDWHVPLRASPASLEQGLPYLQSHPSMQCISRSMLTSSESGLEEERGAPGFLPEGGHRHDGSGCRSPPVIEGALRLRCVTHRTLAQSGWLALEQDKLDRIFRFAALGDSVRAVVTTRTVRTAVAS